MQDLVDTISAATGLEAVTARKAVGIVLDFVQKSVPPAQSSAIIDRVPGARAAAAGAAEDEAEGGGSTAPGLAGLADRLMAEGVDLGTLRTLGHALLAYLKTHAGEDAVRDLVAAVPGLEQFA